MLLGKNYEENNLAEMLALVGGAMFYIDKHDDLEGYDDYYSKNKDKDGFHYKMQKYGDRIIRRELKERNIRCGRRKAKRFYRYSKKGQRSISFELYDYWAYIMDYILSGDNKLLRLTVDDILKKCTCELESKYDECLDWMLDWQYQRLNYCSNSLTERNDRRQRKASALLKKLNNYPGFETFEKQCRIDHNSQSDNG